jgi:hypothetical protein
MHLQGTKMYVGYDFSPQLMKHVENVMQLLKYLRL